MLILCVEVMVRNILPHGLTSGLGTEMLLLEINVDAIELNSSSVT